MKVMRAIAAVSLMYLMSVSITLAGSYEEKKDAFTGRTSVLYEISGGGLTDGVNVKLSEYDEADGTLLLNFVARGQGRMDPAIGLKTADGTIHELTGVNRHPELIP